MLKRPSNPSLINREGFWASKYYPNLPIVVASDKPWKGQKKFLKHLIALEARLRPQRYKGWSTCRICKCSNGSEEYVYNGWRWPSGFAHYVLEHNVRPSLAFQEMVVGSLEDS